MMRNWFACCMMAASLVLLQFISAQSAPQRSAEIEQVYEIDRMIESMWRAYELEPATAAKDYEWCRRVYLDVLGRIPSVDELRAFTGDKSKRKKEKLIDRLLNDEEYTEEFARNWTTLWSNLLIGRTGGNDNNSMINRAGMQKYLRDSFARNKPYDRMVYELVTATGSTDPENENFDGATNFLIDKVNADNGAQATAATSRIFLGLQVQCTQCHNHPFNEWKQQKYWEMNAFFRQTRARGGRRAVQMGQASELMDVNYQGESNLIDEADLFYELRNGLVKVAYPVFVDGTSIEKHGAVSNVNRRQELAKLMLQSDYLDQAIVNRMWGHFLGYGFTKPVDDLGPHNPPSHPELLDYLSQELRAADYDLRQLIKWIVLSRPYSLSSRISDGNKSDDPLAGEIPRFSRFYLRQMQAEQLYESLLIATMAHKSAGSYEEQERRKNMWLQQFTRAFGTDEGDETTSFNGTIPQVLMMFNGDLIRQATDSRSGGFLDWLFGQNMSGREKIDYLFLAGLSRPATNQEMTMAQQFLAARDGDPVAALQDVWWVVLNSNEFIFNH